MKVFFKAIRDSNIDKVINYLEKKPELANAISKTLPKKDDGQSALQVAFKTNNIDIAKILIDANANINYIDKSDINNWNLPVFHDFLRALVFSVSKSEEEYLKKIKMFKYLLSKNIDITQCDSYNNNSLVRLVLDTDQVYQYQHKVFWDTDLGEKIFSDKDRDKSIESRLRTIYKLLLENYTISTVAKEKLIKELRSSDFYKASKIDTFSVDLINELL